MSEYEELDLTTNVSQIFTELYNRYGILTTPDLDIFENSLYLEGLQSSSIKSRMNSALLSYHESEGTLELYVDPRRDVKKDTSFVAGCGSTQLYKGLVYAIATTFPGRKFLFVQKIPYFSGHQDAVEKVFPYSNTKYQGYKDPKEVVHDPTVTIIEFVTSPNNPNGEFREPETNPDIILGDFVFASSSFGMDGTGYLSQNLKWLRKARNDGKCILSYNSASKQFGHTGDRLGYMWFPMYNAFASAIFLQLNNFIATTVGTNLYGTSHFLNLLPALEEYGVSIRKDANDSLQRRFLILKNALKKRYPGSKIVTVPGSPTLFVKIKDKRITAGSKTAAEVILADTNVEVVKGSLYGENDEYVRINIMSFSEDLATFANRLVNKEKYSKYQLLISQKLPPEPVTICGGQKVVEYVVNPNDRIIKVDASRGDVAIVLPQFLGYEPALKLRIERTDSTEKESIHKVEIVSDFFLLSIKDQGYVVLVWRQPFYKNGKWSVVDIKQTETTHSLVKQNFEHITHNKEIAKLFMI